VKRPISLVPLAGLCLAIIPFSAAQTPRAEAPLSRVLAEALSRAPERSQLVWVFFKDKGTPAATQLAEARGLLTPRALSRRALRGQQPLVDTADLPLARPYVEAVAHSVIRVRHELRWLNAVSVEATADQIRALQALPFVERLDAVRRFPLPKEEPFELSADHVRRSYTDDQRTSRMQVTTLDYGTSLNQVAQINVPPVHDLGLHGEGVIVAVFDAGFNNLAHEALAPLKILARHDFVNGDEDVGDGADMSRGDHGTWTLSTLAGFKPGELIGPAFAASFLLAKTENTDSETPREEDNWAAAAEWVEGQGADVISSSLGYTSFDAPFPGYAPSDLNGETAISTRAAAIAASRGVVVVNSAGNEGFNPDHNTLGAPSDGKKVVAVGAVDSLGLRVGFSSVGPSADGRIKPDVAAQGAGVKVASSTRVNGYVGESGTSFSCPLTAGVVALILQAHPTYTVDQVLTVLHSTASHASQPDNLLGYGIVNALAAIQAPAPSPAP
jgi:subtilisin family serine protease